MKNLPDKVCIAIAKQAKIHTRCQTNGPLQTICFLFIQRLLPLLLFFNRVLQCLSSKSILVTWFAGHRTNDNFTNFITKHFPSTIGMMTLDNLKQIISSYHVIYFQYLQLYQKMAKRNNNRKQHYRFICFWSQNERKLSYALIRCLLVNGIRICMSKVIN